MTNTVRIKAVVVGETTTTFYKEDASTFDIATNDERLQRIITEITPILTCGGVAEVTLDEITPVKLKTFERKSNGIVKLFRVAKKFVADLIKDEGEPAPIAEGTIGTIPVATPSQEEKLTNAALQVMANAQSVSDDAFVEQKDTGVAEEDTLVAVVTDDTGVERIIPGVESLRDHMDASVKQGSTVGMERFMARLANVIDKRGHSVKDLLRFMERNDMPIADDGCLVAFKTLEQRADGTFVDIHSKRVFQKLGSKVFMAQSMVDPSRRNDCSNGLHVARRAYCGGFRGSAMVLIKVAPEDAIAVPQYDSNKMRVSAYHIVGIVPEEDHATIYSNQPFTKESGISKLLGAVLRGDHVGVLETVEIRGAKGTDLVITPLAGKYEVAKEIKVAANKTEKAAPVASIDADKDENRAPDINPTEVAATVAAAKKERKAKAVNAPTNPQIARGLFTEGKWAELEAFRKPLKKSYGALGFNFSEISKIEEGLAAKPQPKKEPKKMEGTRAEIARSLYDQAVAGDKTRWASLWRHQKECKKSWKILGFSDREVERIKTNKPDWV